MLKKIKYYFLLTLANFFVFIGKIAVDFGALFMQLGKGCLLFAEDVKNERR